MCGGDTQKYQAINVMNVMYELQLGNSLIKQGKCMIRFHFLQSPEEEEKEKFNSFIKAKL